MNSSPFLKEFSLPGPRDRMAILGRTGSGKTHFAAWVLSQADWTRKPWVIIDYKRDDILKELPASEIPVTARVPKEPGLYIVRPLPSDEEHVEQLLMRLWQRRHVGLYVDEGHLLPDKGGLQTILTTGRSRSVPAIVISQRPVWVSRHVFSEADYVVAFHLNDRRDRKSVGEFTPLEADDFDRIPRRHSWYYDIQKDRLFHMLPVPDRAEILSRFAARNPKRTHARMI